MRLFTVVQIAEKLQVTPSYVRSVIHRGELSALKFGQEFRVEEEEFYAFIRSRRIEGAHALSRSPKRERTRNQRRRARRGEGYQSIKEAMVDLKGGLQ